MIHQYIWMTNEVRNLYDSIHPRHKCPPTPRVSRSIALFYTWWACLWSKWIKYSLQQINTQRAWLGYISEIPEMPIYTEYIPYLQLNSKRSWAGHIRFCAKESSFAGWTPFFRPRSLCSTAGSFLSASWLSWIFWGVHFVVPMLVLAGWFRPELGSIWSTGSVWTAGEGCFINLSSLEDPPWAFGLALSGASGDFFLGSLVTVWRSIGPLLPKYVARPRRVAPCSRHVRALKLHVCFGWTSISTRV